VKGLLSRLIVVVNGSESSIAAAKYAICLKRELGSEVTAVYVVDTATIRQLLLSRIFVPEESVDYERSLESTGKRYLGFIDELAKAKRAHISSELRKGSIAGEVVRLAEELRADCIVVGGWERDSAFKDVIQEAYREIAKNAPCSVLVVRKEDAERLYSAL